MAPIRPEANMTSLEDCVHVGNGSGAITTNSTCALGPTYDHVGAMKFVVTTILVYALLGTVSLLCMRIRRRANNMQKAMDLHDEHVQRYLREGGRLKAEGNRMKLRFEIRKFYSTVPQCEQDETHYHKKPWLRDPVVRHDSPGTAVQHGKRVPGANSAPPPRHPGGRPAQRDLRGVGACEEHELQPLCSGVGGLDCPTMHELPAKHVVSPGAKLDSLPPSEKGREGALPWEPRGLDTNGNSRVVSPFSGLGVHQSAGRPKHSDASSRGNSRESSAACESNCIPDGGEANGDGPEMTASSDHPGDSQTPTDRRESLVSFDGRDVQITSLSRDDVSAGLEREAELDTEVVFSTDSSLEPKGYVETGI